MNLINYTDPKKLIKRINNGKITKHIKFDNIILELVPVLWNDTYCYSDKRNENYINLNKNKKVTRFCVKNCYLEL